MTAIIIRSESAGQSTRGGAMMVRPAGMIVGSMIPTNSNPRVLIPGGIASVHRRVLHSTKDIYEVSSTYSNGKMSM